MIISSSSLGTSGELCILCFCQDYISYMQWILHEMEQACLTLYSLSPMAPTCQQQWCCSLSTDIHNVQGTNANDWCDPPDWNFSTIGWKNPTWHLGLSETWYEWNLSTILWIDLWYTNNELQQCGQSHGFPTCTSAIIGSRCFEKRSLCLALHTCNTVGLVMDSLKNGWSKLIEQN